MNHKRIYLILSAIVALALAAMACRVNFDLPVSDVKTGPVETETIEVPAPSGEAAELTLSFGAGELRLEPGGGSQLISGTAIFNVPDLRPEIRTEGDRVRMETGDLNIRGIPNFRDNVRNEWDLRLGDQPLDLRIDAGAYQANLDLGGLSLQSLEIGDGAADVDLDFSEPNRVDMGTFRYETGASNVEMTGLANANFERMVFHSGAGDYTLNFSGELQRDATVEIESSISQVRIIVPEGRPVRVIFDGGLSNIDTDGAWEKSGDEYTLEGEGPSLTIYVEMGVGDLELRAERP